MSAKVRGEATDILIVGSGAGASPLALRLSQHGFAVQVLEKGPQWRREDFCHDEVRHARLPGLFRGTVENDPHVLVRHGDTGVSEPELSPIGWSGRCVGGGTVHMSGSYYRFHPADFELRTRFGSFETIADWPYSYGELEPYYCQAEWETGVSGRAGVNPFEGPRSRDYPMPPLTTHPFASVFDRTAAEMGLHPFPTPRGINSRNYRGRPPCADCDVCVGYGCPTGARSSMLETLLPRAKETGRCEIRSDCMVHRITVDRAGRATGCVYFDKAGIERRVRASVICVCCSAVESARLLLLSSSCAFPDGLANGSGLVGRNLQFHCGSTGRGRFLHHRHPEKQLGDRGTFLVRSIMDHYFLPGHVSGFPKGGLYRFYFRRVPPLARAQAVAFGSEGVLWGHQLKRKLREAFSGHRTISFEAFHDFIPNSGTYVELDPEVRDDWGLPVARIHLREVDHHKRVGGWLRRRGLELLEALGADNLVEGGAGYTTHVMAHGTCRAGSDPSRTILNAFCQAHEVPNLFVVDGSFMPTSGGAPSTLTIIANSFRTADYIVDRARTFDLAAST